MDVSKGIFNFRDVREVCDDKGVINNLKEYTNGSSYKYVYGKIRFGYAIEQPKYLESYSMVND